MTVSAAIEQDVDINRVQKALKGYGYEFGELDGQYGPLTEAAVTLFKEDKGIQPADAHLDAGTLDALGIRSADEGLEALDYNNPLNQVMETAWFEGRKCWAIGANIPIPVDPQKTKVAQEYMVAYQVSTHQEPKLVPLQLNIYDSVPGMPAYSPIWHLNYVIVPKDYQANTLRSVEDVRKSGYEVVDSQRYVN